MVVTERRRQRHPPGVLFSELVVIPVVFRIISETECTLEVLQRLNTGGHRADVATTASDMPVSSNSRCVNREPARGLLLR